MDEAIAQFEKVTQLQPQSSQGFYNLAKVLKAKGKIAEAEAALQKAKQLDSAKNKTATPN